MKGFNSMQGFRPLAFCLALILLLMGADRTSAETGAEAWLRYAALDRQAAQKYSALPASVFVLGDSPILDSAKTELIRGVRGMLGKTLREDKSLPQENAILLGTLSALQTAVSSIPGSASLREDGFFLSTQKVH